MTFESGSQLRPVDRFRQIVVHAGSQASFAVAGQGVGRQGNDRQWAATGGLLDGTNPTRRFEAVHHRHLAIHQDCVIGRGAHRGYGLRAVVCQIDLAAEASEDGAGDFAIDLVVLDEQHASADARVGGGQRCLRRQCAVMAHSGLPEPEGRAASFLALEADFTFHALRQFADDDQAEAGAAKLAGRRIVGLGEGGEELLAGGARDADAGVADRVTDPAARLISAVLVCGGGLASEREEDRAALGKFDGVAQQVAEDLLDPVGVAEHRLGQVRGDHRAQQDALRRGHFDERLHDSFRESPRAERDAFEFEPVRLDLRQIKDVVEQMHQRLGRHPQGIDLAVLRFGERRVEQQVGHADDAVHRRADLVTHVGQETRLGDVGTFGLFLGQP